jgi:PAXNEB protein
MANPGFNSNSLRAPLVSSREFTPACARIFCMYSYLQSIKRVYVLFVPLFSCSCTDHTKIETTPRTMASSFRRRRTQPGGTAASSSLPKGESGDSYVSPSHSASSASSSSSWLAGGRRGTKPSWASSGIALTSTGLADLDVILGGGQPLGTCMMLAMDDRAQASLGSCLVRCWCAEVGTIFRDECPVCSPDLA